MATNIGNELFNSCNPHCWSIITPNVKSESFLQGAGPATGQKAGNDETATVNYERFRDSLELAARFAPPARRLVVLPESRGKTALEMVRGQNCGVLLLQPEPGGTASAVFMALMHVIARDQDATVVINPLEYFTPVDAPVVEAASYAANIVERLPGRAILLAGGSSPDNQNAVWIQRGQKYRDSIDPNLWTVKRLTVESNPGKAQALAENGGLNHKSIVVAKVRLVWKLGLWCIPEVLSALAWHSDNDSELYPENEGFRQSIFRRNSSYGFTENILMRVSRYLAVLKLPEAN
jgi:hypothetical protein